MTCANLPNGGMGRYARFQKAIVSWRNLNCPNFNSASLCNNTWGQINHLDMSGWNVPNKTGGLHAGMITTWASYSGSGYIHINSWNVSNWYAPNLTQITTSSPSFAYLTDFDMSNMTIPNLTSISFGGYAQNLVNVKMEGTVCPNITSIANMCNRCSKLSSNSINNIIDFILNIDALPMEQRLLNNSTVNSVFYGTPFNSYYYSDRIPELEAKGWKI